MAMCPDEELDLSADWGYLLVGLSGYLSSILGHLFQYVSLDDKTLAYIKKDSLTDMKNFSVEGLDQEVEAFVLTRVIPKLDAIIDIAIINARTIANISTL